MKIVRQFMVKLIDGILFISEKYETFNWKTILYNVY